MLTTGRAGPGPTSSTQRSRAESGSRKMLTTRRSVFWRWTSTATALLTTWQAVTTRLPVTATPLPILNCWLPGSLLTVHTAGEALANTALGSSAQPADATMAIARRAAEPATSDVAATSR